MVDLSQETKISNKFLEYCRFSPNPQDYSNIKREYLLPSKKELENHPIMSI